MKINELIQENKQIDEISLTGVAQGTADAVGGAIGGIAGMWNRGKAAYQRGKAAVDPDGNPVPVAPASVAEPAAEPAAAPVAGASTTTGADRPYVAPPSGGTNTAPAGGTNPAPTAPAGGGASGDIGSIMQSIDKLDADSKKQLAGELEKSINTPPPAEEKPAALAGGTDSTGYDTQAGKPQSSPGNRQKGDIVKSGQNTFQYTGEPGKEWFVASGPLQEPNPQADRYNNIQAVGGKKFISADNAKRNLQVSERRKLKKKTVAEFHSNFLGMII